MLIFLTADRHCRSLRHPTSSCDIVFKLSTTQTSRPSHRLPRTKLFRSDSPFCPRLYISLRLNTRNHRKLQATMAVNGDSAPDMAAMLKEILSSVRSLKQENAQLSASVDAINGRVNTLAGIKQIQDGVAHDATLRSPKTTAPSKEIDNASESQDAIDESQSASPPTERRPSTTSTSKIILTSYPGQAGVDPIPLNWGM